VLGAELWTCYGAMEEGETTISSDGVKFTFSESKKAGRKLLTKPLDLLEIKIVFVVIS
jgi:hypothetical protein